MFVVFFLLLGASWFLVSSLAAADVAAVENSRLADVARKTDHAVFFTDAEGNIGWVNEGFTKVSGHAITDARGKNAAGLLLGTLQNLNVTQKFREGLSSQRPFVVEMLCSNRRGHRYWMSVTMTPLFDAQQTVSGYIGLGSDITSRRRGHV